MSAELETGHRQLQPIIDAPPPGTTPPLSELETAQISVLTASTMEAVFPSAEEIPYKYVGFKTKLRRRVRKQQNECCAYCGKLCRGHTMGEPILAIHHVIPKKLGGSQKRENAVGLCADVCHPYFDKLIFEEGKTFFQVIMEEGRSYAPLQDTVASSVSKVD